MDITHATDDEVKQLESEIHALRMRVGDHDAAVRLSLKKLMLRHERDRLAGLLRDAGIPSPPQEPT
jgi:hypothetical protein